MSGDRGRVMDEQKISFRIARDEDRNFIAHLSAEVFSVYGNYHGILSEWFLHPKVITVVGSKNGIPVSFAMLRLGENKKSLPLTGELLAIAVLPEYQRHGSGEALLGYLDNLAKVFGLQEIQLHTADENLPARSLFHKAGYRPQQSKKSYYPKGQSAIVMVKKFDS